MVAGLEMSGRPFALVLAAGGLLLVGAALGIAVLTGGIGDLWKDPVASSFLADARGWAGALFVTGAMAAVGGGMLWRAANGIDHLRRMP